MKRTLYFFIFLSGFIYAQHGVSPAWGPEISLPAPTGITSFRGFLYSNIGVFSNGKRVVIIKTETIPEEHYYTYSYDGINWSVPQRFAPDTMVIGLNNIKMISDPNDNLHFIWESKAPEALFYSRMDSSLNLVLDTVRMADNPMFGNFSDMYISTDLKNRLHVMWNEGKAKQDPQEVFYSRSTDNGITWSVKDTLSNIDGIPSAFPRGQFAAYSGDTLAIAWRDSVPPLVENWDIQMVISTDGGQTWSLPVTINSNDNMQGDPDLVIDPQGRFHLFYHEAPRGNMYDGIRIVYGYSDDMGNTWNPSSIFLNNVISNNQRSYLVEGSRYDIQNDVLWTFWKEEDLPGKQGGDMLSAYSLDRGVTWSSPEYVTDKGDTSIGFKAVALLPDGGLAVNYELPNYPSAGKLRVFYKERTPVITSLKSQISQTIALFPNPAYDEVRITARSTIREITLCSLQGLMLRTFKEIFNTSYTLNIKKLPTGIYLLKVTTEKGIFTKKLIKY